MDRDIFTRFFKGVAIMGFARCSSFGEIPSSPVAFLTFILLMYLFMKVSSIGLNWKALSSISGKFSLIAFILGWLLSILVFVLPMFLATFTKKLLNISVTLD